VDSGDTWSAPARVNDDPPGRQQFFTWMTVDPVTGYLWFVFYDRRNYADEQTDVWCACSRDGGNTFHNFKVSESPFFPTSNIFFGDYTGISACNQIVRPIWTRLHDGKLSAWVAIVDSLYTDVKEQPAAPFSLEQNFPNPFRASTTISFKLNKPSLVDLGLYDLFGNRVETLLDRELLQPGKYIETLDTRRLKLSPGVYYFMLKGDGISRHMKVLFQP
jgi:hypothetical protein